MSRFAVPFFVTGLVLMVIAALAMAREYAVPIAVAAFVYLLINAFAASVHRAPVIGTHIPRWLAKLVAVIAFFALMTGAGQLIARNVAELGTGVPGGQAVLLNRLDALVAQFGIEAEITAAQLLDRLEIDVLVGWALRTAQGVISDVSLVFLYVLFLLVDERYYEAKLRALISDDARRDDLRRTIARIGAEVRLYLWLMTVLSLGVALMTYIACEAVGLSGAGFWAFLAFGLNFVPTIGSITAVVLPVVYGLLTLDDPLNLGILIALLAATQFVAGEIVLPRLMGDRMNLSSFVILLMLVVWGALWGPAGMFMAIPITVILVMIAARFETTRPVAIILSRDGRLPDH